MDETRHRMRVDGERPDRSVGASWRTPDGLRQIAESARRDARQTLSVDLDFSPSSLEVLDGAIDRFFVHGEPIATTTILALGAYVGEVIIRNLGGRWNPGFRFDECAVVDAGAVAEMYPMRRVAKRFEDGPSTSIYAWFETASKLR